MSGVDEEREYLAEERLDPRVRLKKLKARAKSLEKEESYWAVSDSVEVLFRAADELVKQLVSETAGQAALDIAVNLVMDGIASLLDGI